MQAALQQLPADYREVLVLKHLEGWSFAEIADATGASTGALKVRAHRARSLLKEELMALVGSATDHDNGSAAAGGAENAKG
jgi:RNA polymerase sigma-70 factor (ECF subfamily)